MITYRKASKLDWENIAILHARSWQLHYRGIVTDEYLDNQVLTERKKVWIKRFKQPNDKQKVILAEQENKLIGLSCVYLDADEKYGALLDNLHVHQDHMRKGIGKTLMIKSAKLVQDFNQKSSMYLWVLTRNEKSIKFYEAMGGVRHDTKAWKTPDNTHPETYRYVWRTPLTLSGIV